MKFVIAVVLAIIFKIIYFLCCNYHSINNVCKTYSEYYSNRDDNKNCYYNPDSKLTVPEIITRYEYPLEIHTVTTTDGYILTLFRILNVNNENKKTNPVVLEHGFAGNSGSFVGKGQNSLAFILSRAGYDVWLVNFRGSKYSRNHIHLNDSDPKYWDFSFHENSVYDIPSILDFIAVMTKQKIICIGFSIGAASNYVYASIYPELASQRVETFISLAPAAYLEQIGYPMRFLLSAINYGYSKNLLPFDKAEFSSKFIETVCLPYPFQMEFCYWSVYYSTGYYYEHVDPEVLPILIYHAFDTFSAKAFAHFSQLFVYGKSRQFNYNSETNLNLYGFTEPPDYNFSKLPVPTYIIRTNCDTLVTKQGVEKLHSTLPTTFNQYDIHVIDSPHFSHLDFLFGKNAETIVYKHIIDFLDNTHR